MLPEVPGRRHAVELRLPMQQQRALGTGDPARGQLADEAGAQRPAGVVGDGAGIAGPDVRGVVAQERRPRLEWAPSVVQKWGTIGV